LKRYRCIVTGRVQGVWYRRHVADAARAAGFRGYVRNLPDGTVVAVVDTPEESFGEFKAILQKGSPMSHVESIECEEIPLEAPFHDFGIVR